MKQEILNHLANDARLATILPLISLPEIETHNDIYADLLGSIISQQLSVKAAATIENRFLNLFPNQKPLPELVLATEHDVLRGVGLSNQKASYMKNIAAYWIDNQLNTIDWLSMSDDDIIATLTPIKGVGKWTVQMILMFRLNRLDVFPIDDLGIRQGMIKIYGIEETGKDLLKRLHEISDQWRPYRSVACRYVWKWKDTII
ncbi:MAG: DNA-3-methyladenine glycosylase 2 family protein [Saprospiraceae bacterium]|nr:DNA-3-methyladenine glycosylase 2 family protein [Saprospiraceae bacterium]